MPNVIRLGDPTDHGGKVIASGAPQYTVDGIPVALLGDACSCPRTGHHDCTIAEGAPDHAINGVPVAYEGHRTTCGAGAAGDHRHLRQELSKSMNLGDGMLGATPNDVHIELREGMRLLLQRPSDRSVGRVAGWNSTTSTKNFCGLRRHRTSRRCRVK